MFWYFWMMPQEKASSSSGTGLVEPDLVCHGWKLHSGEGNVNSVRKPGDCRDIEKFPVAEGNCMQAWRPEFDPCNPHDGKEKQLLRGGLWLWHVSYHGLQQTNKGNKNIKQEETMVWEDSLMDQGLVNQARGPMVLKAYKKPVILMLWKQRPGILKGCWEVGLAGVQQETLSQ